MRPRPRTKAVLAAMIAALYALHQDAWNWRTAEPLVFGVVPIGLFYHLALSLAAAGVMALVVRFAWPAHLEDEAKQPEGAREQ